VTKAEALDLMDETRRRLHQGLIQYHEARETVQSLMDSHGITYADMKRDLQWRELEACLNEPHKDSPAAQEPVPARDDISEVPCPVCGQPSLALCMSVGDDNLDLVPLRPERCMQCYATHGTREFKPSEVSSVAQLEAMLLLVDPRTEPK
jgi:hypothetical protein